jgi:hypothetical protein
LEDRTQTPDQFLADIAERLSRFPATKAEVTSSSVAFIPSAPNGFSVKIVLLQRSPPFYSVYYNGWHEEFAHPADARLAFAFGLSNICRLREFSRDGVAYRWIADFWTEKHWKPDWEIIRFLPVTFKLWQKPNVAHLQNTLIDGGSGFAGTCAMGKN